MSELIAAIEELILHVQALLDVVRHDHELHEHECEERERRDWH
jgi:hypothetical protein